MGPATNVLMPAGDGPHPAVVLGAEAYGVNISFAAFRKSWSAEGRPFIYLFARSYA